ncbi:hypothetical protein WA538_000653, partial [Blastocystis sp. DL]
MPQGRLSLLHASTTLSPPVGKAKAPPPLPRSAIPSKQPPAVSPFVPNVSEKAKAPAPKSKSVAAPKPPVSLLAEIRASGGRVTQENGSQSVRKPLKPAKESSPSKPTPRAPASLLAEIRASGGRVTQGTEPRTQQPIPQPSQRVEPRTQQSTPQPRMSSNLLAEINGADVRIREQCKDQVRSILRQRREQQGTSEPKPIVKEEPPKVAQEPVKEEPVKEPPKTPEPDLLQRRKLLFVESSSSS